MLTANVKMKKNNLHVPLELVTTACLSGGLAIVFSLASIVLCVLAIIYRYDCSVADPPLNGAQYFIITLIKTYILHGDCTQSLKIDSLTKADSVFILVIIILAFAVINLLSAATMVTVVNHREPVKHVDIFIYVYIGSSLALLVVDLTLSVHFGMDHTTLKQYLSLNSVGLAMNYEKDMIRLGALMLMSIALKGFIGHTINIVLLTILVVYVIRYQRMLNETEHSIHKLGALAAFDHPRRFDEPWSPQRNEIFVNYSRGSPSNNNDDDPQRGQMRENPLTANSSPHKRLEDPWQSRNESFMAYSRGAQMNPAFNNVDERTPTKENPTPERGYDRSHSWLLNSGAGMGSRPFSYLEEPKRPIPVKLPTPPTNEPPWRRDPWSAAPPVPDPDYSPPPRRLKSALKSNYM